MLRTISYFLLILTAIITGDPSELAISHTELQAIEEAEAVEERLLNPSANIDDATEQEIAKMRASFNENLFTKLILILKKLANS